MKIGPKHHIAQVQPTQTRVAPQQKSTPAKVDAFAKGALTDEQSRQKLGAAPAGSALNFRLSAMRVPIDGSPDKSKLTLSAGASVMVDLLAQATTDPFLTLTLGDGEIASGQFRGIRGEGKDAKLVLHLRGNVEKELPLTADIQSIMQSKDIFVGDINVLELPQYEDKSGGYDLAGLEGFPMSIDSWDRDEGDFATAAKRGMVTSAEGILAKCDEEGLHFQEGKASILASAKEFFAVAKVSVGVPAYRWSDDAARSLESLGKKVPRGADVDLTLRGGRQIKGEFLGVHQDSAGAPYVVVRDEAEQLHAYSGLQELTTRALSPDDEGAITFFESAAREAFHKG